MSDNELIKQFIINQQSINTRMAEGLADIKRGQSDMTERLFGAPGQPGVFSYLKEQHEKDTAAHTSIEARVSKVENFKRDVKVWLGAAVSIVSTEGGLLAFWFSSLTHKVRIP